MKSSGVQLMYKFIFPAAFPSIVSGLRLAVGTGWIFLVAGEMVGAQSGLGFLIVDARNTLNLDYVLAGIIFIGVSGFILDRLIGLFEGWVGNIGDLLQTNKKNWRLIFSSFLLFFLK